MNYELISAIFNGPWAIESQYAMGMTSFVHSLLEGKNVVLDEGAEYPYDVSRKNEADGYSGNVRIIPVKGVLMKGDQTCGARGMATLGNRIKEADANTNIDAIVIDGDTPGGSVDGTQVFSDIIENTSKPIVWFVNGLTASAGMWLASKADKIIASTELDKIGSVGIMLSIMDIQPALEKQGVKFHEIYSKLSSEKNIDFSEIRKGNYDAYIKDTLDPLAEKFQSIIKENRPNVKDKHLRGKMFFAKDVKGTLIDDIGSFEFAIAEALKLANSNSQSNTNTMSGQDKNVDLTTEKGIIASIKGAFGLKTVAEKEAEKIEAKKLATEKATADKLASEKEVADKIASDKEAAEKKAKDDRIAELEAENAILKGKPGAKTATAITETDGDDTNAAHINLPEGASIEEKMKAFTTAMKG